LLAISISSALETQRPSNRKQQQKKPGKVFIPFVGSSCQQKDGQRLPGTYPLRKGVSIRVRRVLEIAPPNPQTGINPSIQVDNCDYQKLKYLVLTYIYIYIYIKPQLSTN
jgi:hypothetical protein